MTRTVTTDEKLFTEPFATTLEDKRERARGEGRRLVYDCTNNAVYGDRVYCTKECAIGKAEDGSLSLVQVLKGIGPAICQECRDYENSAKGEHE